MSSRLFAAFAAAVLLTGCISMEYTGEKLPPKDPDSKVPVYTDSAKVTRPYQVLGVAKVSGDYQEVSRDRMVEKLRTEARKCGADAILIVEQQVIPGDLKVTRSPVFTTAFDYDDTNGNWSQLSRDVDQNFARPGAKGISLGERVTVGGGSTTSSAGSANNFRRVIRAEFLRYHEKPAEPAKPAEKPAQPAAEAARSETK